MTSLRSVVAVPVGECVSRFRVLLWHRYLCRSWQSRRLRIVSLPATTRCALPRACPCTARTLKGIRPPAIMCRPGGQLSMSYTLNVCHAGPWRYMLCCVSVHAVPNDPTPPLSVRRYRAF